MRAIERLGIFPSLFIGVGLFMIGSMTINFIINSWWPFDVNRLDLVRAIALDRADAPALLEAANFDIILAFLAAILVAITGVALPLAYVLNKRFGHFANRQFGQSVTPRFLVTMRQSMAVGIWVAFCVWLQMNRALGFAVALLVAGVLVLFEILLQIRSRANQVIQ